MNFSTIEEAKTYACENIGKYEAVEAYVGGKPSYICSTSLPLEERLRDPIEKAVEDFLVDLGIERDKCRDIAADIGAKMSSELIDQIEKHADVNIVCAYLDY